MSLAIKAKAKMDQFLKSLVSFQAGLSTFSNSVGSFTSALLKVSDTGTASFAPFLRAENLAFAFEGQKVALLFLKTSVLGGSVVTRFNLFRRRQVYKGGAIAYYSIFTTDGVVYASGIVEGETKKRS